MAVDFGQLQATGLVAPDARYFRLIQPERLVMTRCVFPDYVHIQSQTRWRPDLGDVVVLRGCVLRGRWDVDGQCTIDLRACTYGPGFHIRSKPDAPVAANVQIRDRGNVFTLQRGESWRPAA